MPSFALCTGLQPRVSMSAKNLGALSNGRSTSCTFQRPASRYIGYGTVTAEAQPASEFITPEGLLFDQPLAEPRLKRAGEPVEHAEHVVGVDWRKTFEISQAKWFKGGFANQNIVCKLRDEATVDFLVAEFGVEKRN